MHGQDLPSLSKPKVAGSIPFVVVVVVVVVDVIAIS